MRTCALLLLTAFAASVTHAATPKTKALPNGIQAHRRRSHRSGHTLRDDVLRVRATHSAALPEDASIR